MNFGNYAMLIINIFFETILFSVLILMKRQIDYVKN